MSKCGPIQYVSFVMPARQTVKVQVREMAFPFLKILKEKVQFFSRQIHYPPQNP